MTNRFETFSCSVFNITKYWNKIATEEMKKFGLKAPYAIYLATMLNENGDITSAQLSELCGRDKADVSRAVTVMEKKGLISRVCSGSNLYRAKLILTEDGKKAAEQILNKADIAVDIAGNGISDSDRAIFYKTLESISGNLKELSKTGLPEKIK